MFASRISLAPKTVKARIAKIPSRAPSAYNNFAAERLAGKIGQVGSDAQHAAFSDKVKGISSEWAKLSESEKAKYAPSEEALAAAETARAQWKASLTEDEKRILRSQGKLKRESTLDASKHPWLVYLAKWRVDHPLPEGSNREAFSQLTKECGIAYRKEKGTNAY